MNDKPAEGMPLRRLRARASSHSVFDVPIGEGEHFRLNAEDPTEYVLDRANGGATLRHAYPKVRGKARVKALKKQRQRLMQRPTAPTVVWDGQADVRV